MNGIGPWLEETWEMYYSSFYMGLPEVYHIVLIAIGLTLLRLFLNAVIFKVRELICVILQETIV